MNSLEDIMDFIKDPVKKLYFRFLLASFGSALIGSIYGMVDTAMVGQYHGPDGAAAIAVIAPIWNIIYSLGLLAGIGGSVLYAIEQGRGRKSSYFTSAVLLCAALSLLAWGALWLFEDPILRLMGADDTLLPLCRRYLTAVKLTVPVYPFTQLLSAFLQCCCYGIGQAAQPILSQNYGAGRRDRIALVQRYALLTCAVVGVLSTAGCLAGPNVLVHVFMSPTQSVLAIAPGIIRVYSLGFLLLPLNVYAAYYFQATLHPGVSFAVSVLRGAAISGGLIVLLPPLLGADTLWAAMPATELVVAMVSIAFMLRIRAKGGQAKVV